MVEIRLPGIDNRYVVCMKAAAAAVECKMLLFSQLCIMLLSPRGPSSGLNVSPNPVQAHLPADMQPAAEQQQRKVGPPRSPSKPARRRKVSLKRSLEDTDGTTSADDSAAPVQQPSKPPSRSRRGPVAALRHSAKPKYAESSSADEDDALPLRAAAKLAGTASPGKQPPSKHTNDAADASEIDAVDDARQMANAGRSPGARRGGRRSIVKAEDEAQEDNGTVPQPAPKRPRGRASQTRSPQRVTGLSDLSNPKRSDAMDHTTDAEAQQTQQHANDGSCEMGMAAEPAPMKAEPDTPLPCPRSSGRARRPSAKAQDLVDDPTQGMTSSEDHTGQAPATHQQETSAPQPLTSRQVPSSLPRRQLISRDASCQTDTCMPMPKATSKPGRRSMGSAKGLPEAAVSGQQISISGAPHRAEHQLQNGVRQSVPETAAPLQEVADSGAQNSIGRQLRKRKGADAELQGAGGTDTGLVPASDSQPILSPLTRKRGRKLMLPSDDTTGDVDQSATPDQPTSSISPEMQPMSASRAAGHPAQKNNPMSEARARGRGRGRGGSRGRGRGKSHFISSGREEPVGSDGESQDIPGSEGDQMHAQQHEEPLLESGSESNARGRARVRGRGRKFAISDGSPSGSGTEGSRAGRRGRGGRPRPGPSRLSSETKPLSPPPGDDLPASTPPAGHAALQQGRQGKQTSQHTAAIPQEPTACAPKASVPAIGASRPNRKSRLASATKPAMVLRGNTSPKGSPARSTGSPGGKSRLSAGSGSPPSPHWRSRVTRQAVQETDQAFQQALEASKAEDDQPPVAAAVATAGVGETAQSRQAVANQQPVMAAEPPKAPASAPGQASAAGQQHGAAICASQPVHDAEGAPLPTITAVEGSGDGQHSLEHNDAGQHGRSAEAGSAPMAVSLEAAAAKQSSVGGVDTAQPAAGGLSTHPGGDAAIGHNTKGPSEHSDAAQPASAAAGAHPDESPIATQGALDTNQHVDAAQPAADAVAAPACDDKDPASKASATPALDAALAAHKDCTLAEVPASNVTCSSRELPTSAAQKPAQNPTEPSQIRSQNGLVESGPQAAQNDGHLQAPAAPIVTKGCKPHAQGSVQGAIDDAEDKSTTQDRDLPGNGMKGQEEQLHFLERSSKAKALEAETARQGGSSNMQQPCPVSNGQLLSARSNVPSGVMSQYQRALWSQSALQSLK